MARFRIPLLSLVALCSALFFSTEGGFAASANPGAGTYFGVVQESTFDHSGYVRAVIGKSGTGTVSVKLGDEKTCVVEVGFPGGGGPIIFHPINPNPVMLVNLALVELPQGGLALNGTITDDEGDNLTVTLFNVTPSESAASLAGRYTLVLETPSAGSAFSNDLAGFGALQIFKGGRFLFQGTLSDGSAVMQRGVLNSSGGLSIYAKQSHGRVLSGDVTFADDQQSDFSGTLELSAPGAKGAPDTDTTMQIVGSHYDPATGWSDSADWTLTTSSDHGATVAFTSDLIAHGDILLPLSSNTALANGLNLSGAYLEKATGRIFGGYVSNLLGAEALVGVVFRKTNGAFGFTSEIEGLPASGAFSTNALAAAQFSSALERKIPSILRSLKTQPAGIFAIEAASQTSNTVTVSGGSLTLSNTVSSGSTVTVNGGTLLLGGTGIISPENSNLADGASVVNLTNLSSPGNQGLVAGNQLLNSYLITSDSFTAEIANFAAFINSGATPVVLGNTLPGTPPVTIIATAPVTGTVTPETP